MITALIIARDERKKLARAIKSVSFAEEVIVIDNNSNDDTYELALSLGAKVYKCNVPDFSYLRNFALNKARGDYVFYIDADEEVDRVLAEEISNVGRGLYSSYACFEVVRKNFFYERDFCLFENMPRLFKKSLLAGWMGSVHETPVFKGERKTLAGFLMHHTHDNFFRMVRKTGEWSDIEARLIAQSNTPGINSLRIIKISLDAFIGNYLKRKYFMKGRFGLMESIYQGFSAGITFLKVWQIQKEEGI